MYMDTYAALMYPNVSRSRDQPVGHMEGHPHWFEIPDTCEKTLLD